MARPKSPDFEQRQQLILRSAAELFAARGYGETLLEDIAEHCGIKRSSIYHYHASKHALLHSLITWKIQDLSAKVDQAVIGVQSPEQRLATLIRTLVLKWLLLEMAPPFSVRLKLSATSFQPRNWIAPPEKS